MGRQLLPVAALLTGAAFLFLAGVTYFLLGGGVTSFFLLRRRARRLAEQRLLDGDGAAVVRS